jgi:hypothetical protein
MNGVCCPENQFELSGQCVDANTYNNARRSAENTLTPTCIAFHPSLGTCLACNGNFQVNPATGTTCI